jgi:hypothetical protein
MGWEIGEKIMSEPITIDFSQLSKFQSCHRQYYWSYINPYKKVKRDEREVPKEWGSLLHKGLALYYQGKSWAEIKAPMESFIDLDTDKCRTKDNLITTLEQYIAYYSGQDKAWKIISVEVADYIMIGDLKYVVKIDLIVEDRGNYYPIDHKTTTKKFGFFNQFEPNTQCTGYTAFVQEKYGSCSGFIPNGIFIGHRANKYKGEPAGFHVEFERSIVNRYPNQIQDFKVNVTNVVKEIEICKVEGYWAKTEGRGSCPFCQFRELCISCDDQQILEALYEPITSQLDYLKPEEEV